MPPLDSMYNMSQIDYEWHQDSIAKAIKQYRGHTERDLDDLQLLRQQTALQASLIWEQQIQICDMNKAYLQLSDEKERIVLAENRIVHEGMEHISTMMTSMQQSLQQRHEIIAANMDRIDSPKITSSILKLKTALQELQMRNAHLVMRNEKLNTQLSFMPPEMWEVVATATKERSPRYEQQRIDPHYLHLSAGEYRFMQHELGGGIVADRMRRCAAVTSMTGVLLEADEVLEYLKSHNGIVDQPIDENNNFIEDAVITAPAVRTATDTRDLRGCIPSANEIDTPTVAASAYA
jgi:hypothetical protein